MLYSTFKKSPQMFPESSEDSDIIWFLYIVYKSRNVLWRLDYVNIKKQNLKRIYIGLIVKAKQKRTSSWERY